MKTHMLIATAFATVVLFATPAGAAEEAVPPAVGTTGSPADQIKEVRAPLSVLGNWKGSYDNKDGYRIGTAVYITRQNGPELSGELELTQRSCGGRFPIKGVLEGDTADLTTVITPNNAYCGERKMSGRFKGNSFVGIIGSSNFELHR